MTQKNIPLTKIAELVDGKIVGKEDMLVHGFAPIEAAGEGQLTFLAKASQEDLLEETGASAVIVPKKVERSSKTIICVDDPYLASAIAHTYLIDESFKAKGIHPNVVIGDQSAIGEEVSIGPFVAIGKRVSIGEKVTIGSGTVIGDDVMIGDNVTLHANVTIEHGCTIGSRVTLHPGVVIGSDGYGYAADKTGCHHKRPQVGTVRIDDDVEVGANSCIDRATFGVTWIKQGTKVDNLVQIGHNVVVGEHSLIVSQVGIAGSATLGRNVVLGGKVAVKGHITLEDGVMVAAKSGVHTNLSKGAIVGGSPVLPIKQWTKAAIVYGKLPDMHKQLKKITQDILKLKEGLSENKQ